MDLINSYAVVTYLGDPIATFVDTLRREFSPDCPHRAHITILPPRPLSIDQQEAIEHCRQVLKDIEPFEIRSGKIDVFESTQVIKLCLSSGAPRLTELHNRLNSGKIWQVENFDYVPHITLAQDVPTGKISEYLARAQQQWAEFGRVPSILVESVTLVQQLMDGCWVDLFEMPLGRAEPVGVLKGNCGARCL